MRVLGKFSHVPLSGTRSFHRDTAQKTPFGLIDWSSGYMHFRFLQLQTARRKSRLTDLHRHRQIMAVIGIVYCPVSPSLQLAYNEFSLLQRQLFPEVLVARCFAMAPSEEQLGEEVQRLTNMVIFPAGQADHLEQHLELWMHDLAAGVLAELENWVLCATPAGVRLSSYADTPEL
ncbi:TRAPP II complex, partial [Haematococcus lacustris]